MRKWRKRNKQSGPPKDKQDNRKFLRNKAEMKDKTKKPPKEPR